MQILLTGKNGQVGFELQRALSALGNVIAVDRVQCDLSQPDNLRTFVRELRPQIIVNPAAYTSVDRAESDIDLAMAVNASAPRVLAEEAARSGALLVHYSTDYVFDGKKKTPYTEDDLPNPQGVYGASKLAGEQAVQANLARHLVLRTSWVVGAHGGNFAKTMIRLAAERDILKVVADQFGAPTSAALLADVTALLLHDAIRSPDNFPYGLYHLTARGATSWHAYACHVIARARAAGRIVKVAPDRIEPINAIDYQSAVTRPANSRLDTSRLRDNFGLSLPDWESGVDHVLEQIFQS